MPYYGWHMMGRGNYFGIGSILDIILWVIIAILIISLLVKNRKENVNDENNKTPLDVLKERYAKGEINKKEYEEIKKDLT